MKQQKYITSQETKKCQKIVYAFNELFEQTDILVLDTEYGFVLLRYYGIDGFQFIDNYTQSNSLFDALWQEWMKEKLIALCYDTPLIKLDYDEMYKRLPGQTQKEILDMKKHFLFMIDTEDENTKVDTRAYEQTYITNMERSRCGVVADLFRKDLEKDNILIKDAGKYGYVMLQYCESSANFDSAIIFKNSQTMFDTLLDEWFVYQITELMKEKQVTNTDIDVFYDELAEEEKEKLKKKKDSYEENARRNFHARASFI